MAASRAPGDFCFVHAADLHLDTPFKGVSATAPHVGAALREASLEAFDNLVQLCLDREAAFLVLAGDIYDGSERGLRAQLRFRDGLQRLSDAGICSFVVHGNHDPVDEGWSAVGRWPELAHVFGSATVEAVPVIRDGRRVATVQGISYDRREVTENLSLRFSAGRGEGREGLQVGVLHCNVTGTADGYAAYSPCTLDDLLGVGLDYWALGHIHSQTVLAGRPQASGSWVVYSGNLQARSPKGSENGPKGALVVHVREDKVERVEAVACDRVRFSRVELDIAGLQGVADVRDELSQLAVEELERADGRSVVLRAVLVGRGPAHAELRRDDVTEGLLSTLRDECRTASPFVWWDRIDRASAPELDLDVLRHGDDFVAELLRIADELAGGDLPPVELPGLLGKMPRDLGRLAEEILTADHTPHEFFAASAMGALDVLDVNP